MDQAMAPAPPEKIDFRTWNNEQAIPVFFATSVLIAVFLPGFHFVLDSLDLGVPDRLIVRVCGAIPAFVLPPLVWLRPQLRKHILHFQTIQITAMLIGTLWVSGFASFENHYLAGSMISIIGSSLALNTFGQVFWSAGLSLLSLVVFTLWVIPGGVSLAPFSFYISFFCISGLLSTVKIFGHRREFRLRSRLETALSDLRIEKSLSYANAQMAFVGQLAGSVAHAVNNPLAILHGAVELLQRKLGAEGEKRFDPELDYMASPIQRIRELTRSLLFFSGRNFETRAEYEGCDEMIDSTLKFVEIAPFQEAIQVKLDLRAQNARVRCSPQDFMQALFYVLKNAVEAATVILKNAKPGESFVEIRSDYDVARAEVVVQVRDSGLGVHESVRGRLFEPFVVGPEKADHVGMGLCTARAIMERTEGRVEYLEGVIPTTFVLRFRAR